MPATECDCPRCRVRTILGFEIGDERDALVALLLGMAWQNGRSSAGGDMTIADDDQVVAVYAAAIAMWDLMKQLGIRP